MTPAVRMAGPRVRAARRSPIWRVEDANPESEHGEEELVWGEPQALQPSRPPRRRGQRFTDFGGHHRDARRAHDDVRQPGRPGLDRRRPGQRFPNRLRQPQRQRRQQRPLGHEPRQDARQGRVAPPQRLGRPAPAQARRHLERVVRHLGQVRPLRRRADPDRHLRHGRRPAAQDRHANGIDDRQDPGQPRRHPGPPLQRPQPRRRLERLQGLGRRLVRHPGAVEARRHHRRRLRDRELPDQHQHPAVLRRHDRRHAPPQRRSTTPGRPRPAATRRACTSPASTASCSRRTSSTTTAGTKRRAAPSRRSSTTTSTCARTTTDVVVRGNVFANASSHGLQARSGGVIKDNLFLEQPDPHELRPGQRLARQRRRRHRRGRAATSSSAAATSTAAPAAGAWSSAT